MKKLGLGAPRRLANNGKFQSTKTSITTTALSCNSIDINEHHNDHSNDASNNININNTNLDEPSNHIPQSINTEHQRKHSLQLTPNRYSPMHKRLTLTNIIPGTDPKLLITPTKNKNELIDSPEIGRREIQHLSAEKLNDGVIDIFDKLNSKENNNGYALTLNNYGNKNNKNEATQSCPSDFDHIQTLIDKTKEIYQLKKEIKQYRDELSKQKKLNQDQKVKINDTKHDDGSINNDKDKIVQINKRKYKLFDQIGKGGSSKVYRSAIIESPNRYLAIKVVNLDEHEVSTVQELKGEVKILHKLRHCSRVVRLLDYSITAKHIYFVMECGNLDLATVLSTRHSLPQFYDLEFIRYHAQEMIKCINTIHELDVVHLDLKPANFVFVSGVLKLIDFGISNSIKGHTVNVYREFQMGTPNYMAPETLIDCAENENGSTIWKVGKPADIWSLGCILYQLTYGITPYATYTGTKKILAITNPSININYPVTAVNLRKKEEDREVENKKVCPYLIDMIRKCLIRDPTKRIKSHELLDHIFINPTVVDKNVVKEVVRGCVGFGGRHPELKNIALGTLTNDSINKEDKKSQDRLDRLIDGVWKRVSGDKIE
jgi:serine/threonine-protein kinase TTK/MPS1